MPVGTRVVLRYRLPAGYSHPMTDVIGELVALDPAVVVRTADSRLVQVAPDAVVALKALGARPIRTGEIRALENAAAAAWPGLEQGWIDGWLLRAGAGFTGRANSATPLGDPGTVADPPRPGRARPDARVVRGTGPAAAAPAAGPARAHPARMDPERRGAGAGRRPRQRATPRCHHSRGREPPPGRRLAVAVPVSRCSGARRGPGGRRVRPGRRAGVRPYRQRHRDPGDRPCRGHRCPPTGGAGWG